MHSFSKEERLCAIKLIDQLYHSGSSFVLYPFRVFWLPATFGQPRVKVLFSVPKRRFKHAVDRNLLKRRMREAYRLHKAAELYAWMPESGLSFALSIGYIGKEVSAYALIEKKMRAVFLKLRNELGQ